MLDTNILISAAFFPNDRMNEMIEVISSEHELVLSDLIANELIEVASYPKFNKVQEAKNYLKGLSYREYKTPPIKQIEGLSIRDDKDYPILFSAVKSGVDIFITGDKDFVECGINSPKIMTVQEFCSKYIGG